MLNSNIDKIVGLYNTTAGQSTGGFDGKFLYVSEWPVKAMDTLLTTKYVNFGSGCTNCVVHQPGVGTGFFVTPLISNATLAIGIHFGTADDYPNRDPITVTVEGSNETTNEKLHQGSSWTLLYSGPTGINLAVPPDRSALAPRQWFNNTIRCASYRLLVTSQRGDESSVQYSEARILGYI